VGEEPVTLRIAIDVTSAVTQRAGVGRYTRELVRALRDLPDAPELIPFFIAPGAEYPLGAGPTPLMRRQGGRSWRLEALLRQVTRRPMRGPWNRADLYHAPEVIAPPTTTPLVTTVHDLSYLTRPQYHTRLNGAYLRAIIPLVTRRARLVIADSEATKRDLVHYIGLSEHHVRVVYPSIAAEFWRAPAPEQVAETCARYGLSAGFILSVGTQEPRKNLTGTLAAYRLLRRRLPDAPPLALVGGAGWGLDEERLVGPEEREHVLRLGFVPDTDLVGLYAACAAFVYPSHYEGWGLPVAEALALGAPVVTSNVSSLPEVAGDAALLVDPTQPAEIAAALYSLLTESALAARLRREGPPRARLFSRERWASETLRVYEDAVGQ